MKKLILFLICFTFGVNAQYQNVRIDNTVDAEEVSIAINPRNPQQLGAGANIRYFFSSNNGGLTWTQNYMSSSYGVWGDPSLIYDDLGYLYFGHLSNPPSPGYWIDRIVVQRSTDNGVTWNSGASIGYFAPKNQDKEWLAADLSSPLRKGNIYVSWTEFDIYGSYNDSDSSRIMFSASTDHGITWSAAKRINEKGGDCIDEDNTVEGAVPTVGPNGEVYIAWAGPLGLMFDKSLDGGLTWGTDKFVSTIPSGWDMAIPGISRANGLPITACDTSHRSTRGNIYICWADQRNGATNTDVFISRSVDGGANWSDPIKVNNDNTSRHQFFPWMAIDQVTGTIWVVFYDRRNTTDNATDVYVARSRDGGLTFDNLKVSESSFTPNASTFFGDYTNIAAYNGKIYPIWMRLVNGSLSVYTALMTDTITTTPVELNDLRAKVTSNKVLVNWQTITEKNNRGFAIEKSKVNKDGVAEGYNQIGFVSGAGTTTEVQQYSFTDSPTANGKYLYRLVQFDLDGTKTYSNSVQAEFTMNMGFSLTQNYPNPFNPKTNISYYLPKEERVSLKIFDVLGNEVMVLVDKVEAEGFHEVEFSLKSLSNFPASGMLVYRINAGDFTDSKKMILLK